MPRIKAKGCRIERDFLGEKRVPAGAYYGIQTQRAIENFPISGVPPKRGFITATAIVKLASTKANLSLGLIDKKRARAVIQAAREIISGSLHEEFAVDSFNSGAGTSHNMNANEVIANRAIEILGGKRGDYRVVHPNDHVNMSQSSNDVYPTAMRLSAIAAASSLLNATGLLERALRKKAGQFDGIMKSGRTHLRDAAPVTLGREFGSYAFAVKKAADTIKAATGGLKNIGLGATAVGTGINTHPRYRSIVLGELRKESGIKGLKKTQDTFEAINSAADFVAYSAALRSLAVELIKIANDLRLLSSGPAAGLGEITLPAVQPGSSIMPGKVNPVMAEMLNMVCFQAIGNDLAVTMAAQAGQLELNVMTPVINHNILTATELLENGVLSFTDKCVNGIEADKKRCASFFERSTGSAAALNALIGYEKAAEITKEAVRTNRSIKALALEKGLLNERQWTDMLKSRL